MKNKNVIKATFLFFTSCLFAHTLQAQLPGVEDARTKYPDVSAVYLTKSQQYHVFMDKGVLSGVCDVHEQIYINKESGLVFQSRSVGTNKFVEASNIKA